MWERVKHTRFFVRESRRNKSLLLVSALLKQGVKLWSKLNCHKVASLFGFEYTNEI